MTAIASVIFLGLVTASCARSAAETAKPIIDTASPTPTATPTATATLPPTATPEPTAVPTPEPALGSQGSGPGGSYARWLPPDGIEIAAFALQGISAGMESLGILASGQLDSPHNPHNVGWYYLYDFPGGPGNAVFSAHVDYFPNIIGPFNRLSQISAGEQVTLTLTDGRALTYEVISNTRYSVYAMDMGEIIWPSSRPSTEEWITMITCGGRFRATSASGAGEYLDRDVVVARRLK